MNITLIATVSALLSAAACVPAHAQPMDAYTSQMLGGTASSQALMAFGNEVLESTETGKAYLKTFYQLLPFAVLATMQDGNLLRLTQQESQTIAGLLAEGRKKGEFSPETGQRIEQLLEAYYNSPAANEKLREGLAQLRATMPVQSFLRQLNSRLTAEKSSPSPMSAPFANKAAHAFVLCHQQN
ncbi:MAG: hypothetical protein PHU14_03895 [Methylovulum sp.]|nr:hypothetical protein [Methylovulum sp.]